MAVHYLLDLFNDPYTDAKINDVHAAKDGRTLCVGNFIVRVPGEVQIDNPTTLPELVAQKHLGLLAYYTGFQHITSDDLLDTTSVDLVNSTGKFGSRSTIAINANGGLFQSLPVVLGPLPPGAPPPAQAIIVWETFTYEDSNPPDSRFQRVYVETAPDMLTAQVSFNNGVDWINCTDGAVINIPLAFRGMNFLVRLTNGTGNAINLGSWSVVY